MNPQLSQSELNAFAIWMQQNRPEFTGNIVDIDGVVVDVYFEYDTVQDDPFVSSYAIT